MTAHSESHSASDRHVVQVSDFLVPSPSFTQAISVSNVGRLMFISGITARAADGSIVGEGDIELQARTIFENMRRLLEADGARIDDVVKTTTYVRSAADIPKVGAIRLEYFHGTPPASTSVEVAGLFDARQLVEIDAIAAPANDPT